MKKKWHKKGSAVLLAVTMVLSLFPEMKGNLTVVQAAENTAPASEYWTDAAGLKEFSLNEAGDKVGKIIFGQNGSGVAQKWKIAGTDSGITGDNIILFADTPLGTSAFEDDYINNKKYFYGVKEVEVYPNHYGSSDLRDLLSGYVYDTNYFSTTEVRKMNNTTINSYDDKNNEYYATTDKLYAAYGVLGAQYIAVGTNNDVNIDISKWGIYDVNMDSWNWASYVFWLRSQHDGNGSDALLGYSDSNVGSEPVDVYINSVMPAFNLDLSSVLFASAANAASSSDSEYKETSTMTENTYTLRYSSNGNETAVISADATKVKVTDADGKYLMVQNSNGVYTQAISGDTEQSIKASNITMGSELTDFNNCKVWIESTTDRITTAKEAVVQAAENTAPASEYWTDAAGLKGFSLNKASDTVGKIKFGADGRRWAICGVDDGTLALFSTSEFAKEEYGDTSEYSNSNFVRKLTTDSGNYLSTDYFSTAELNKMADITVKTNEPNGTGNTEVSVEDKKLYLPNSYDQNSAGLSTIYVGSDNNIAIELTKLTDDNGFQKNYFWLRSSFFYSSDIALVACPGGCVDGDLDDYDVSVVPAFNLNLSAVLFASAADAASSTYSGYKSNSKIKENTYTLRYQSSGTETAVINPSGTQVTVTNANGKYLMVQNSNGVYAQAISGDAEQTIKASNITMGSELTDFNNCKVWIESTTDRITTAKEAEVQAAENTSHESEYWTDIAGLEEFSLNEASDTVGKIIFGQNGSGVAQKWKIVGTDSGITGDNIILFADTPLGTSEFEDDYSNNKKYFDGVKEVEVYPSHYGSSDLRDLLSGYLDNTDYFSTTEVGKMNNTTINTYDDKNHEDYTTADKLYAAYGVFGAKYIAVGTNNDVNIDISKWGNDSFWLRPQLIGSISDVLMCYPYKNENVHYPYDQVFSHPIHFYTNSVVPAFNLDLSSVLFASAANAASSSDSEYKETSTMTENTYILRYSSNGNERAVVSADGTKVKVTNADGKYLMVQNSSGVYSQAISGDTVQFINASDIIMGSELTDFNNCKVWIESTTDRITTAKEAEVQAAPTSEYWTDIMGLKEFSLNEASEKVGKIIFGQNGSGVAQKWKIAGTDSGIKEDNIILFADTSLGTSAFEEDYRNNKKYFNGFKEVEVYPNHYGSSDLRDLLLGYLDNTDYFSTTEVVKMNNTIITNYDDKNRKYYTTADKLYAANGFCDDRYVTVGTNNDVKIDTFLWGSDDFWLRTHRKGMSGHSLMAFHKIERETAIVGGSLVNSGQSLEVSTDEYVYTGLVQSDNSVVPVFNLNLSSVLFASAANAASASDSEYKETSTMTENTYTLRYSSNGNESAVISADGTKIKVTNADGKYLMVQNNNGVYAQAISGDTGQFINANSITMVNQLTGFNNCKVWIESTTDRFTIAKEATQGSENWNSVSITAGNNMTKTSDSGNASQTADDAMTSVVYTADEGYYFPKNYVSTITGLTSGTLNDVTVTRNSDSQITIAGKPSGDVSLTLTAATLKTYTIEADITSKNFGITSAGYSTRPSAQTVTITNKGNQTVSISKKVLTNFEVSSFSVTSIAPGSTATFTVQPKAGLTAGNYSESIVVQTANGTSVTIPVSFKVDGGLNVTTDPASFEVIEENAVTFTEAVTDTQTSSDPSINGDDGTTGWDAIKDKTENADVGTTIVIDMGGTTVVPGDVIDSIKGKDVNLVIDLENGITWTINGTTITKDNIDEIDFAVTIGTNAIPVDVIKTITGERDSIQISLAYDGEFGFSAALSINMDKKNAGYYANLFYYNKASGKLEFLNGGKIDENGNVVLNFTHASDYNIVVSDKTMNEKEEETPTKLTYTYSPQTGDESQIVLLGVLVMLSVLGICGLTYVEKRRKIEIR